MKVTAAQLKQLCPKAPAGRVEAIAAAANANFATYGITTLLRVSHFFAQVAHESGGFRFVEELASGAAYEGRKSLGNTQPGDGRRFKGHGLIQTTGRANHREVTKQLRARGYDCPDFEKEPRKLTEFPWAFLSACEYWHSRRLNAIADRDDVVTVTKKVNGGTNGLMDRKAYLARAKVIFAEAEEPEPVPPPPDVDPKPEPEPQPEPKPAPPDVEPTPEPEEPEPKTFWGKVKKWVWGVVSGGGIGGLFYGMPDFSSMGWQTALVLCAFLLVAGFGGFIVYWKVIRKDR